MSSNSNLNQETLHRLGVPMSPTDDENTYLVRISPKSKGPLKDYYYMKNTLKELDTSVWDSVKGNHVVVGDWMGFIIGDTHDANVELYQVCEIMGPEHRPSHWESKQYTDQEVQTDVDEREVVVFKNQDPVVYSWNQWKSEVEYKPIYMPRGTVRARHPF